MILAVKRNNNFLKSKNRNKHCIASNEKPHCEEQKLQYQKDKEEMIKHKTLHIILQIEIPKGKPESVETKDRKYNGQKDRQCKGQKDKQLSTKHYTENKRLSNRNPTKNQR